MPGLPRQVVSLKVQKSQLRKNATSKVPHFPDIFLKFLTRVGKRFS